ncbi:hypothetical protein NL676_025861 [Syzygium grande]|nr:hypothetical protein NL676_025861 [Syzygium grande]
MENSWVETETGASAAVTAYRAGHGWSEATAWFAKCESTGSELREREMAWFSEEGWTAEAMVRFAERELGWRESRA